jgi:Mrp family chromosome partitioning ATPase
MNKHSPLSQSGSLIERAAELYGFGLSSPVPAEKAEPAFEAEHETASAPVPEPEVVLKAAEPGRSAGDALTIDREKLREAGFILPDAPAGALAEEFRIVKRQLLLGFGPGSSVVAEKRRTLLVCSAQSGDGKTFCAVNLALSMAGERDLEVLLVDGDFPKPDLLATLGVEAVDAPGLVDALADPGIDPENLVLRTDLPGLSLLTSGRRENDVPELLGSGRTREVLERLTAAKPNRIVLFDSPPALMASEAGVLATHVGQVLMVVRADKTTEADLKEAVGLLSGCGQISLLLNGTGFAATGRRFGSYYGYGQ